ncbi:toll/interleukin-1 receptor domain-containing protein [Reichenbachiella agarivorans]|uniref:Toll/interleukin-1 receptor domain-containing protein n=1 Tax=Reichenbachiella agarivorans TaxID=2979464 RepID=A0ABY6CSH0_9BACT|nr:toll/interleukin-1 receptor domain-containing protein [Reichenbachiella agarivorans]UXP32323.1 toll/interleukin-1 receptor domain-containing protein [Reichenbachiella agarivorans]
MKVFISWSGDLSKKIAESFRQWIPGVIQAVKPYYTPDDITKGTRWGTEIAKELDDSKVGIICLTRENLLSPWIMFEAGALSKNLEQSKVCPLLFGIDPADIQGPLIQFQAAKFSKVEMKKVVKMINSELGEHSLASDILDGVFEMWWPKLDKEIKDLLSKGLDQGNDTDLRSEREMLEEILYLSREISIERKRRRDGFIHPDALRDLIEGTFKIANEALINGYYHLDEAVELLMKPIDYIIGESRDSLSKNELNSLHQRLSEIRRIMSDLKPVVPKRKVIIKKKAEDS